MKLYATTENEKGKKEGMGGNSTLKIELKVGNKIVAMIFMDEEGVILYNKTTEKELETLFQKGKSQKGEKIKCEHKNRITRLAGTPQEDIICGDCGAYQV